MRPRFARSFSAGVSTAFLAVAAALVAWSAPALAAPAVAPTRSNDAQIAKAAVLVAADFPEGFTSQPPDDSTYADNIRLAKGVGGCAPYIALERATAVLPQAHSALFSDGSRSVSNEVDVFKTDRAASDALALVAKPSVVGCLKKLYEKQLRQDPALKGTLDTVVVSLDRQDIASLGDDRVVYEGTIMLTGTDGSIRQVRVGTAIVQVGRTVDTVTYRTDRTDSADLAEILTPAMDASVGRLRSALASASA